jgi:signal transduction histidine kinase
MPATDLGDYSTILLSLKNLLSSLNNLLSNATKYRAPGRQVLVQLRYLWLGSPQS